MKEQVLSDWNMAGQTQPGNERGNTADDALTAYAKQNSVPLITNEGYTPAGLVDEGLRKQAKDAGVAVFTPREFYDGKIDESAEALVFLERFEAAAPAYLEEHWKKHGRDKADELLSLIHGYYCYILVGETEGRTTPVRVRL